MRDYRPPFLTDADDVLIGSDGYEYLEGARMVNHDGGVMTAGGGLSSNDQYKGNLFGKDRIGHTTPSAEMFLTAQAAAPSLLVSDIHPNEFALPTTRIAKKMSVNNVSISRSGVANNSTSYNASTVR